MQRRMLKLRKGYKKRSMPLSDLRSEDGCKAVDRLEKRRKDQVALPTSLTACTFQKRTSKQQAVLGHRTNHKMRMLKATSRSTLLLLPSAREERARRRRWLRMRQRKKTLQE